MQNESTPGSSPSESPNQQKESEQNATSRANESALIAWTFIVWLFWAWTVMALCHELGHVLVGVLEGAKLIVLEIRPWHLPHSIHAADRFPSLTLWGGPVLGSLVPLAVALVFRRPALWFVAWFCVVANSLYLLLGYFTGDPELDSTKMLRSGTPSFVLVGVASIGLLIGYLRFRVCCVDVLSGKSERGNQRVLFFSATVLIGVLTLQSIAGSLLLRL